MVKIRTSNSFGSDKISSYFQKLAVYLIESSLAFIFNTSLKTSHFPHLWKNARITLIFKNGDKTEKLNYRPISNLPIISGLFENIVFNQLYQYLIENNLIHPSQSGFLKNILH